MTQDILSYSYRLCMKYEHDLPTYFVLIIKLLSTILLVNTYNSRSEYSRDDCGLFVNNLQVIENPNEVENVKRRPKTQSVHFNTIVPSPVKVLMTSPFKCLVSQF